METPQTPVKASAQERPIHWPSVFQLGLSLIGIIMLWGLSALVLFAALASGLAGDQTSVLTLVLTAAGMAFSGALLIPSAGYALLRVLDKPAPFAVRIPRWIGWIILAMPPLVILGHFAAMHQVSAVLLLPAIHITVTAISIIFLLSLGLRGLRLWSPQLNWGVFNMGLVAAPAVSLLAEFAALAILGIIALLLIALLAPDMLDTLVALSDALSVNATDAAYELLEPYITSPVVIFGSLLFTAVIVPLIEEVSKTAGVWLLMRRKPSPADGFAAGLLSGAGYAMFENFALGSSSGEDWALITMARMGTSLIHIITAGLTGWALAGAWAEKKYLRLGLTYLVSVGIHALWNGTVVLTTLSTVAMEMGESGPLTLVGPVAPVVFALIIIGCFVLLFGMNASLRHAIIPSAQNPEGDGPEGTN